MINDISTGDADRLGKTNVSAPYAEVWGDSIAYDSTYQALTRLTERMRDLYKGKSPIIAAYTHRGKKCISPQQRQRIADRCYYRSERWLPYDNCCPQYFSRC